MKTIALVCGSLNTCKALNEQLKNYLGENYLFSFHPLEEEIPRKISADLIILSSESVARDCRTLNIALEAGEVFIARRTLRADQIGSLVNIDPEEKVLFVNDHIESARECIADLEEIGFLHLKLIPCAPPDLASRDCRIAITAGEAHLVPPGVTTIYDLGCRVMDFPTILAITEHLGLDRTTFKNPSLQFFRQIVKEAGKVKTLNTRLLKMMEGLSEGMISYTSDGEILVVNEKACSLLMLNKSSAEGKKIQTLMTDKALTEFLLSSEGESETLRTIFSRDVLLSRISIEGSKSMVCRLKPVSEMEEDSFRIRELKKKGYYAKHHFHDIIGTSPALSRVRETAARLAPSSLTILIEGESGTGKELMASAIHNGSRRKEGPYLALNLSAVNESLLESELFGYEPGSFTGASREGKAGLFEQADGGTLFLDEIGDISPKIQQGLLRVLQEGEVMRIGGSRIRKIDVRILAATNKNLSELAARGRFREDLLYRIKQGYIRMPSLRERREDIPLLIKHLLEQEGWKDLNLDTDLQKWFNQYRWPGNIREMGNLLSCMTAITDTPVLKLSDIPEGMFSSCGEPDTPSLEITDPEFIILEAVEELSRQGRLATRDRITARTLDRKPHLPPARIRRIIESMANLGWLEKKSNRYGTTLTEEGRRILEETRVDEKTY